MQTKEILEIGTAILLSLGGAGAVLGALSSWLGKVWASRILEKDRAHYQEQLELTKSRYLLDVEKNKVVFQRYSESQFGLYNSVWVALCKLEKSADSLWESATKQNLRNFAKSLKEAKHEVKKGALVIENNHFNQLSILFEQLERFQFGKSKLLDLRGDRMQDVNSNEIRYVINGNGQIIEALKAIMAEIKEQFSSQIRGDHLNTP